MKARSIALRALVPVLLIAAVAQAWLVQRSHEVARALRERVVPYGDLHYETLWLQPWGAGHVWGLSFQPEGLLSLNFGTPPGYRLTAEELRFARPRWDEQGRIDELRGELLGLQIPVGPVRIAGSDPRARAAAQLPDLADLGLASLVVDLRFRLRRAPEQDLALLHLELSSAGLGRAVIHAHLDATDAVLQRAPDHIRLRRLRLEYADAALLERLKAGAAARSGMTVPDWEKAMTRRVAQLRSSRAWDWDAAMAEALQAMIATPLRGRIELDPPGGVPIRELRRYRAGEWPQRLGLRLIPVAADAAAP